MLNGYKLDFYRNDKIKTLDLGLKNDIEEITPQIYD